MNRRCPAGRRRVVHARNASIAAEMSRGHNAALRAGLYGAAGERRFAIAGGATSRTRLPDGMSASSTSRSLDVFRLRCH